MYKLVVYFCITLLLSACGSGGGADSSGASIGSNCSGECFEQADIRLLVTDVEQVIAQAVAEANARGLGATIAVTDRVGNVLGVYRMNNAQTTITVATTRNAAVTGGLENLELPAGSDALAAIAKAVTASYLSTEGNGFSTRTANQIVQSHFNPGEDNKPSGPLFGVQFSQLACSDFIQKDSGGALSGIGPQRSPLGLSADPGGFPLYKNGVPVGGVGVISDAFYSIDEEIFLREQDADELIALAASFFYQAPLERRANRITVDGKNLRFSDALNSDLLSDPGTATPPTNGSYISVPSYLTIAAAREGRRFGFAESGVRADTGAFASRDAFVFVNNNDVNRYPPIAGTTTANLIAATPLTAAEVTTIADQALAIANRARAQIRQPLNSQARVTISIVDTSGNILTMVQTRDAPVFGVDVSLQKARTAAFFSSPTAGTYLNGLAATQYFNADLSPANTINIFDYVTAAQTFIGPTALVDGIAFSDRAGGNLSRPFYPDGIEANNPGPFSKPVGEWSPFSTGLQLDLVMNGIVQHLFHVLASTPDVSASCVNSPDLRLANGIQIFPGSMPIYRGSTLIGGIGISGDGIDQDDMISFLGLHNASQLSNVNNAPIAIRADNLLPQGTRLRYVQCPQAPFLNDNEQNVCAGK